MYRFERSELQKHIGFILILNALYVYPFANVLEQQGNT